MPSFIGGARFFPRCLPSPCSNLFDPGAHAVEVAPHSNPQVFNLRMRFAVPNSQRNFRYRERVDGAGNASGLTVIAAMPVIATMRKQRRRRSHPVWSISADLLMFSKWLSGGWMMNSVARVSRTTAKLLRRRHWNDEAPYSSTSHTHWARRGDASAEGRLGTRLFSNFDCEDRRRKTWSGDHLSFKLSGLGQMGFGTAEVSDADVRIEVVLPWLLQRLGEMVQGAIRSRAQVLLK